MENNQTLTKPIYWVNCRPFKLFLEGGGNDFQLKVNVKQNDWPENAVIVKATRLFSITTREISRFSIFLTKTRIPYTPGISMCDVFPIESWQFKRDSSGPILGKFDSMSTYNADYSTLTDNLIYFNYVIDRIQKINAKILENP
jgi:hypothetical protein